MKENKVYVINGQIFYTKEEAIEHRRLMLAFCRSLWYKRTDLYTKEEAIEYMRSLREE